MPRLGSRKSKNRCTKCDKFVTRGAGIVDGICYSCRDLLCVTCGKNIPKEDRKSRTITTHEGECRKEMMRIKNTEWARHKPNRVQGITGTSEVDVEFGDYKTRLMEADGAHGYLGVITYNKGRDKIQCHVCGLFFKALSGSGHLKLHQMKGDEYREAFSLQRKTKLIGEGTRNKMVNNFFERVEKGDFNPPAVQTVMTDEQRRVTNLGKKRRIEGLNKTDTCPLQLLDWISKLQTKLGYVPNGEDFKREYKGHYIGSINQMYGSYNNAVEKLGLQPRDRFENEYSDSQLLEMLTDAAKTLGRTPMNSDCKRGYLPSQNTYIRRFGSLNRARALVNLPILIQLGYARWAEIKPDNTEYEKIRNQVLYV